MQNGSAQAYARLRRPQKTCNFNHIGRHGGGGSALATLAGMNTRSLLAALSATALLAACDSDPAPDAEPDAGVNAVVNPELPRSELPRPDGPAGVPCLRDLEALVDTDEVTLTGGPFACDAATPAGQLCAVYVASVAVDTKDTAVGPSPDPTLDDGVAAHEILLVVRAKSTQSLCRRWITFDAGGYGNGYAWSFGDQRPGALDATDSLHGDDLLNDYVEAGYTVVDIIWEAPKSLTVGSDYAGAAPEPVFKPGTEDTPVGRAWFRDLGGDGYLGAGSRARAVYEWAREQAGAPLCAHAQSSGSGRLVATLTRFGSASLFDTVVFDGGPVWSYVPWICGSEKGPLGAAPSWFPAVGSGTTDNIDCAFSPANTSGCSYTTCGDAGSDPAVFDPQWVAHSMFYGTRDFPDLDIGVIVGGKDSSSAWQHILLWLEGYTDHTGAALAGLTARNIRFAQGYCTQAKATSGASVMYGPSCDRWNDANFTGVSHPPMTSLSAHYEADLATAGHSTAEDEGGAAVLMQMMSATCELAP